jgi:DNA-binding response OmpR family regulator
MNILIVEDDTSIGRMYKFKFEQSNYNVEWVQDGKEGLKLAEEFRPSLILLDLRMPVMNGDEMLSLLREKEWGANIRVVILTNISKAEAPSTLQFLGVDRYIVKAHHTPKQVLEVVKDILSGQDQELVTN